MTRKICIVTGTRAEYGLLKPIMHSVNNDPGLTLQIIATSMHLSPEFGLTYREIESDGFQIDSKIEMLLSSDSSVGITKSVGIGLIGFAEVLDQLKPDVLLVLGDRFELLAAVSAALIACIPVAHIHGGEITEGAFDEQIRHAITKMSHLHFVAAEVYRKRVIQMGEQPTSVFLVGGLGIDNIKQTKLLTKQELADALNIRFSSKNLLITFHPVTLDKDDSEGQLTELLAALDTLQETTLIFTAPNADTCSRKLIEMIKRFVTTHENAYLFTSLGHLKYLSCIKHVDAVVGNSSSGLLEVPTFKKGTVNIGDRQKGRLIAKSVINCDPDKNAIMSAIDELYSMNFQKKLTDVSNPYGEGGATDKIVGILKTQNLLNITKKVFYDLSAE